MRIIHFSDTHGRHEEVVLPTGDILLCTGDFTQSKKGVESFFSWFESQSFPFRILLTGNHEGEIPGATVPRGVILGDDTMFEIGGILFLGRKAHDHWFEPTQTLQEMRRRFPQFRDRSVDVLISHVPPEGILAGDRFGSSVLLAEINEIRPRFHLFGHVHQCYGVARHGSTLFQNAALVHGYDNELPLRPPLILDVLK